MNKQLLKHMATNSFALMIMVIVISLAIAQNNQTKIYADSTVEQGKTADNEMISDLPALESDNAEGKGNIQSIDNSNGQQLGDRYLIINKSKNSFKDIGLQDLYMDRSICVTITGLEGEVFNDTSLERVNRGTWFTGLPILELEDAQENLDIGVIIEDPNEISDPVKGFSIQYVNEGNTNLNTAIINISLDDIYAHTLYQDEDNIYIDLRQPKDVYDKIIVVDAGHGGTDSGSLSIGEQYCEKDLNLSMLLYLKEILDQEDIKVYYTRTTDETIFLNPRVNLANDLEADFFLSIHCNANESSMPSGTEVLYNELVLTEGFESKQLSQICLEELTNTTQMRNRGLVTGSEMVIIGNSDIPVALIEVGFMSNDEDLQFLLQEGNRRKVAGAIYNAIVRAYDEIEQ